jgi:hypothetical protein
LFLSISVHERPLPKALWSPADVSIPWQRVETEKGKLHPEEKKKTCQRQVSITLTASCCGLSSPWIVSTQRDLWGIHMSYRADRKVEKR